jgi:hypothetical protein
METPGAVFGATGMERTRLRLGDEIDASTVRTTKERLRTTHESQAFGQEDV